LPDLPKNEGIPFQGYSNNKGVKYIEFSLSTFVGAWESMTGLEDLGMQMSMEQFQPDVGLEHVLLEERAGFDSVWVSDHFLPWFHTNAACGFAWTFIASCAQATKKIKFGTGITCPTLRYNPGLVAQAFATLNYMYKDRIFLSVATGEALNEIPLGYNWPSYMERVHRLEEAIEVIRKLWSGELVSFKGNYYKLNKAKLYTAPRSKIPIFVAASGPTVAELSGRVGDGFLTAAAPEDTYRNVLFPALEKGLRASNRSFDSIDRSIELWMSYDKDPVKALKSVRPWAGSLLPVFYKMGVYDPREIEAHGNFVGDEQLAKYWTIGTSSEPFIKMIEKYVRLGFNQVHITSSSPDQRNFIELFGKEVVPYFKSNNRK
jgi:coenzyme F420-dependent glucose-6-phosphate dehydrogenase